MLLCVLIIHSFLLQNTIPLYGYTMICFFIYELKDFGLFSVWDITNKTRINTYISIYIYDYILSFILSKYLAVELYASPLLDKWLVKYFLPVWLVFSLRMSWKSRSSYFWWSPVYIFFFYGLCFWCLIWKLFA